MRDVEGALELEDRFWTGTLPGPVGCCECWGGRGRGGVSVFEAGIAIAEVDSSVSSGEEGDGDVEEEEEVRVPVLWVRVEEVGTVVPRAERLRAAVLRADEVVVDMMIRSMCDARLSDESLRRSCLSGFVVVVGATLSCTTGGG